MIRTARLLGPTFSDLDILRLRGSERISGMYRYEVELVSHRPEAVDAERIHELQRDPITIAIEHDGAPERSIHGVASRVVLRQSHAFDGVRLDVTLVPRVFDLTLRKTSEVFLDLNLAQIVKRKLEGHGLVEGADFALHLERRYDSREQVSQVEETDWDFLCRQLEHWGLFFFFTSKAGRDMLIVSDQPVYLTSAKEPAIRVPFSRAHDPHEADYVTSTFERLPRSVSIRDYNYRMPLVPLSEKAEVEAPVRSADIVEYGAHVKLPEETAHLARVRSEELAAQRHVVRGRVAAVDVEAASLLQLVGGPLGDLDLLVTEVELELTQDASRPDGRVASSSFTAIPRDTPFRPARRAPKPSVTGLQHAKIDGAVRGPYAELDDQGRYRVQIGLDPVTDKAPMSRSRPVRMLQPHSGPDFGMFFPLRPGTEVLLSHVDGDPDRPIIVGATFNPISPNPVNDTLATLNVLRSGGRNELVMDDVVGAERVRLHSPHEKSTLQLGARDEEEEGILTKTEAHTSLVAGRSLNLFAPRQTSVVGSSASLSGSSAVQLVGFDALDPGARGGFAGVGASLAESAFSPFLFPTPVTPRRQEPEGASSETSSSEARSPLATPATTFSDAAEGADVAAVDVASRSASAMADASDQAARDAHGRTLGLSSGPLEEPSLILGSSGSATFFARRSALLFADETTTISSADTVRVVADRQVDVQSPEQIELAAARALRLSSTALIDARAKQLVFAAGLDPTTHDEALAPELSASLVADRAIRVHSATGEILASAHKDFVIHSEDTVVRIIAPKHVEVQGGDITLTGGTVSIKASNKVHIKSDGDVAIEAAGDFTVSAGGQIALEASGDFVAKGASATVEAGDISLNGTTLVQGDLTVTGALNGG